MGNDMADAIRDELREELIRAYGSLEAAADAVSVPYKTLYRSLTTRGKDRSQSVKLELVIEIAEKLAQEGFSSFAAIYQNASERRDQSDGVGTKEDYDRVARPAEKEPTDEQ